MEESGHYYTVFYTSLAVGFDERLAFQHALLAQMPDEIGYLDAANLQTKQAQHFWSGPKWNRHFEVRDLDDNRKSVPNDWRVDVQHAIHVLIPNNLPAFTRTTEFQRKVTLALLRRHDADSLEFGLLLHRLGDVYGHSRLEDETRVYGITPKGITNLDFYHPESLGHGFLAGSMPDYWFLRKDQLFYNYLEDLWTILSEKLARNQYPSTARQSQARTKRTFEKIFAENPPDAWDKQNYRSAKANKSATYLIVQAMTIEPRIEPIIRTIRKDIADIPGLTQITIDNLKYHPDHISDQSLVEFLSTTNFERDTVYGRRISKTDVENLVSNIRSALQESYDDRYKQMNPQNPIVNIFDLLSNNWPR